MDITHGSLQVTSIGILVAEFFLNTSRVQNAIELCKECLILLNSKALEKQKEFVRLTYKLIYFQMFNGYSLINDRTSAIECGKKLLVLLQESFERANESKVTFALAELYKLQFKYKEAKQLFKKALIITIGTRDKEGQASCYGNLGTVFQCLGEYSKAREYYERALVITKEIGDSEKEASCYGNLGSLFRFLGQYDKAKEYLEKGLVIKKQIGDKKGEATCYGHLGTVFQSLGEYAKAKECYENSLAITQDIGDRKGEASSYGNLGGLLQSLRQYDEAKKYLQKALSIRKEIGDREGEVADYENIANVFHWSVGEYAKAKEYHRKALAITKEIGHSSQKAICFANLGTVFHSLGEYSKAKKCHEKGLVLSKEIGNVEAELKIQAMLSLDMLLEGNIPDAKSLLFETVHRCEDMRSFLKDSDQFKISFYDEHAHLYHLLSLLFGVTGNPIEALNVLELGRARALADLMSTQYSEEKQISFNQQTWPGVESIMKNESNCVCLSISYFNDIALLWILKTDKPIIFRRVDVTDCFLNKASVRNVDKVLGSETFRKFHVLSQEQCEDRSWFPSNASHPTGKSSQEDSLPVFRLVEEEDDKQPDPTLAELYKMIVAPAADLLNEPEIIIIPVRSLFKVPFAALEDESGKLLSQTFRIRIVPSLTTLKLIQDSPADYHSQAGALIVGDPVVGQVLYKGRLESKPALPWAREEAEMIARLLGAQLLLGRQATKQEVLERINSVGLVHLAAHGNAERGEIVLAPPPLITGIPQEEDYLLTMDDISKVRLRAKLVVLSCCHSASGQVRAEGVVGIARAFLGSGARSVLVALWAIEDEATKQFLIHFYEHLVREESASESLHQAMKWMRANGFSDVRQWAPFMLIGDNVTFDFRKKRFVKIICCILLVFK